MLDIAWLAIRTLLVLRRGRFMACNVCDACMHTDCSNLMHVEKWKTKQTHGIIMSNKNADWKTLRILSHSIYRTKRFFHMCSDLGPLAAVFGQDSICRCINVSWVHCKYHHTDAVARIHGGSKRSSCWRLSSKYDEITTCFDPWDKEEATC